MGKFWDEFKKDLKRQSDYYGFSKPQPPQNTGDGGTPQPPPHPESDLEECDTPSDWRLIHRKFREIYGCNPYNLQHLIDWWNSR